MHPLNFSPGELALIDGKIQAIITNLSKRFPSMLERIYRDDLFQEGRIAYLQAYRAYRTDKDRFGFVKYTLMVYQRPHKQDECLSLEELLGICEFKSKYVVSILDLLKDLNKRLKRIVLKVLNALPLSNKDHNYLFHHKEDLQHAWTPYYMQLRLTE